MQSTQVKSITAVNGNASVFVLEKMGRSSQRVSSWSVVIDRALLSAFLTEAQVVVELVDGTQEIKRVQPFEPGKGPSLRPAGPYRVERIATQRNAEGLDHLEVFLAKDQSPLGAFNVTDPLLQQLFTTAFDATRSDRGPKLDVTLSGTEVESARLGQVD